MKKRTIKIMCLCVCFALLIAGIPAIAFASNSNRIYAQEVTANPGDTVEIPICISGNSGFMGISVVFSYDSASVTPVSVIKGSLIASGLFDDSIGTSKKPEFKVIWCGSEEIENDGELFRIKLKIDENASDNCQIKVSYESANTFDKDYKEVKLNCEDIIINIPNNALPVKKTIWQKIEEFIVKAWKWFIGLFNK